MPALFALAVDAPGTVCLCVIAFVVSAKAAGAAVRRYRGLSPRIPKQEKVMQKLVPVLCFAYVIWPIDLIPDVIPILGWIDDLIAIVIAARSMLKARNG